MVLWSASAFAQDRAVSGKVTEASSGNGLPGVSVAVKGTTIGTATDAEGNYQVRVPDANATLVFRYLGYTTREAVVGNQSTINVSLQTDARQLDEVVVTALGIERSERSLGYATQQVQGDNLTFTKEQNVLARLPVK
ncbi:carboxypeptidase-like regulatory domain-containing protein [Pontibacter sp. BAB1700]|uniref:carboxypeptidase-like regulatory domain-containing protein n=1 Tax=Pontibacter sp. BAB1700 TaxID=1144253 RepID=UPI000316ED51|nr:carboxypeptidase-like regulatory domain-containing protein [Pontibacter sp. BAB1700]